MEEPKVYAPNKQDVFLSIVLFKDFKKGFFVDIGAGKGRQFSQTLHFEEKNDKKMHQKQIAHPLKILLSLPQNSIPARHSAEDKIAHLRVLFLQA